MKSQKEKDDRGLSSTRRRLLKAAGALGGAVALGGGAPSSAAAMQSSGSGSANYLYVSETGAKGDGRTDDKPAIQQAINNIPDGDQRVLLFEAGKRYYLGSTLTIPLQKVRGVAGNGAYLLVRGNYPALRVEGRFNSTASPGADANKSLARQEFGAAIENLNVYSPVNSYVGVGILATGTFGLSISNCALVGLNTGIRYTGRHRNGVLADNIVWDNKEYGVHFVDCDFHQLNVHGNHISYSRKGVYSERTHLVNVQFVGNDVETSASAAGGIDALIHIDTSGGGSFVESSIVGNTIQGHQDVTNGVKIGNRYCYEVMIADNVIRNVTGPLLTLDACSYHIVEGNTFVNGKIGVQLLRYGGFLSIRGNHANEVGKLLDVYTYGDLLPTTVSDNVARCTSSKPVTVHSNRNVVDLQFDGNRIQTVTNDFPAGEDIVEITSGRTMRGTLVTDNRLDVNGNPGSGLRVAAPNYKGIIVRDNVVLGIVRSYDPLELPSDEAGNVIVKDNLAVT